MKKLVYIFIAVCMAISVSSTVYSIEEGRVFTIKLREWFPGIKTGGMTVGALASGNFFDSDGNNAGWVNISWNHDGIGIEECGKTTTLIRIKIVMNFYDGGRLVLVGPADGTVGAYWGYDDPEQECYDGNCPIFSYSDFLDPNLIPADALESCTVGNPNAAYIAQVPEFPVVRQWFGSYGTRFRRGHVKGFLDHTPIVSPAVVGELVLY
jgi:hypothetical protein